MTPPRSTPPDPSDRTRRTTAYRVPGSDDTHTQSSRTRVGTADHAEVAICVVATRPVPGFIDKRKFWRVLNSALDAFQNCRPGWDIRAQTYRVEVLASLLNTWAVLEPVETTCAGVLRGDYEAHPIRASGRKWPAGILDGDLVHVSAIVVGSDLDDGSSDGGHSIGVLEVDDRKRVAGCAVRRWCRR